FGEPIGTHPDTMSTTGSFEHGWVGEHQKKTETALSLPVIQMGARVYMPALGRLLQVDPVLGGTENDYTYPQDPNNFYDLNGESCTLAMRLPVPFFLRSSLAGGCVGGAIAGPPGAIVGALIV